MDTSVPRKAVVAVAFILLAMSALGIYQGWRRAGASETDSESGLPALSAAPVAGAKTAAALTDPLAPALTEAQVREIARQEARGILKPPAPAATDTDQEDTSAAGAKPAQLLPPKPIQAPALQTPTTPTAPAGGDQNQAPLF